MSLPVYNRHHLPAGPTVMHRKKVLTPMIRCDGPFEVITQEGRYELPPGWKGYIAIDQKGYPYPIELAEQEKTYEVVEGD
jgi:hypothetical protein